MKTKLIGIIICMLLIVAAILPAAGTMNDNKISRQVSSDYDNLIQQFIDAGGCRTDWSEEAKLFASDGEVMDMFGRSVSISGDYVVIGAPFDDTLIGSAYVFKRTTGGWIEEDKLTASDGGPAAFFGWSVSISGDYVVIGAVADDITGSAYVFKRTTGGWIEEDKLTASDGEPEDMFGWSVSISGDYAIIGAPWADSYTGSAYVFKRTAGGWTEEAKLTASDGEPYDAFGWSVSISGDYAIIGVSPEYKTGSAYVFKRTAKGWTEEQKLTASDGAPNDLFGSSISISGDYAIIGAYGDDSYTGSAYVFKRTAKGWTEEQKLTASDGAPNDFFGYSVSISGDYAIIGAPGDYSTGSSYVFKRTDRGWTEDAKLRASDGEPDDYFSFSVSISGDYAIIGAYMDDDNGEDSGSAYVFKAPNYPPEKPTVTGPIVVDPDVEYEYSFVATDPNNDDLKYFIEWGDTFEGWLGPYPSEQTIYLNHSWSENGTYEVKAKAKDEKNVEGPWSDPLTVIVGNLAPDEPVITGQVKGKAGTEYEYNFISNDPNGDDVRYIITWGDGKSDTTGFNPSGTDVKVSHTWNDQGNFVILAKAEDTKGEQSDFGRLSVQMPRNRATYNLLFLRLLEHFPILRHLLRL